MWDSSFYTKSSNFNWYYLKFLIINLDIKIKPELKSSNQPSPKLSKLDEPDMWETAK